MAAKLTRKQLLAALKAAGATADTKAFTRLYVENRIGLHAAQAAYSEGVKLAAFVAKRDAA